MVSETALIGISAFVAVSSLVLLVGMLSTGRRRLDARLRELAGQEVSVLDIDGATVVSKVMHNTLPHFGKHLIPTDLTEQTHLKARLLSAGLYQQQVLPIFLGIKMLLMLLPVTVGALVGVAHIAPTNYALLAGGCASIFGMIGPSFWLDRRVARRQMDLRRALPDALDLVVICLNGGLSFTAALRRVTAELQTAHPLLTDELEIVLREMHLGTPTAESFRSMAMRCDLSELRGLTAAIQNAERFGASLTKCLRTFSETLRQQRQQHAEEMAQKAGTKILFPTLLFIFPAIFLIILGPAAIQIAGMMEVTP